jgi:hypothetical protein
MAEKRITGKIIAITVLTVFFLTASLHAEPAENAQEKQGPQLTFSTPGHDYGTIYFDDVNVKTLEIEFYNTGNAPLLLDNVRACCGTVVTRWTHEPVLPGEMGTIEVRFRVANRPHNISRVVSVDSNSGDTTRHRFRITGRAIQRPEKVD